MKTVDTELMIDDPKYCRILKDPFLTNTFHIECLLSFEEINKLRKGNANVRPPEARKRPFKAMKQTVEFTPQLFHIKNRGITYICSDADYDEQHGKLTITIPAPSELKPRNGETLRYGIADGGHTFQIVNDTVRDKKDYENISEWKMPRARVHFLVLKEEKEDVEPIVEALNTSLQVKQYTLDEYQNKFESLKHALDDTGFDTELVAFRENEDKEWNVIEVIQRAGCFLKDKWSGTQPINMYKSKNKALKMFTSEETRPEFIRLYDVIKDVITLPEYIQSQFSNNKEIPPKSLAKLRCVKPLKKTYTRPGTDYPTDHKIDMAALLPMAAGFRELLFSGEDERYEWRLDPKEVFEYCSTKLYNFLVQRSNNVFMSSQLASDVEYWSGCLQIIMNARQEILDKAGTKGFRKVKAVPIEEVETYEEEEEQEEKVVRRARPNREEEQEKEEAEEQE